MLDSFIKSCVNNYKAMKKLLLFFVPMLLLAACLPANKNDGIIAVPPSQGESQMSSSTKAIAFEKQSFRLSKTPSPSMQSGFQKALDAAYFATVEKNGIDETKEIGFTYAMRPTGAIYAFSEAEVSCLIQERYKDKGQELCGIFFAALQQEYQYLLHPETRPDKKEDKPESSAQSSQQGK